ncbi:hypothetical protein HK102_007844 [Quaeritorhiza haematococci]|nr:hypothetical protein HK102_007844 [Quaeritorhiza haematococci]
MATTTNAPKDAKMITVTFGPELFVLLESPEEIAEPGALEVVGKAEFRGLVESEGMGKGEGIKPDAVLAW